MWAAPVETKGPVTQIHILSFEGPDAYARAGGIATRISGLAYGLADAGFDTHLWFVGDPERPGHERDGQLRLHRWCQWISRHHPGGVYDGEEGKRTDFVSSLPPFLLREYLAPALDQPGRCVVLAEEWQTTDAILHLDWLLRGAALRDRVTILWNANNTFGFDRIDWARLATAAVITTVSRYMQHRMWAHGIDPIVIPNGLSGPALRRTDPDAVKVFERRVQHRVVLAKVARWDPGKRWLLAIDTVGEMKRRGWKPLLIARGGVEAHGSEVLGRAVARGLRVVEHPMVDGGIADLLDSMRDIHDVDMLSLRSPLAPAAARLLFRAASAVLANSGHEPFGLVGLETMAAGGLACTGSTGEDYAIPGWNALVLQSSDPREFIRLYDRLRVDRVAEQAMRRRGRLTAKQYAWNEIIRRNLLPRLGAA